jgi:hypothetical protein
MKKYKSTIDRMLRESATKLDFFSYLTPELVIILMESVALPRLPPIGNN